MNEIGKETIDGQIGLQLSDAEFQAIREFVHTRFGISLTAEKRSLVLGRMQRLLREGGYADFPTFFKRVLQNGSGKEISDLIDHISTNHTFFNRESEHFDFFREKVLPETEERIKRKGAHDLRLWCAASSTGEEPYTLAMLMREHFGERYSSWELGLLATDISDKALSTARAGIYDAERISALPAPLRNKYFVKMPDGQYQVAAKIKADVIYRRFNLINSTFPFKKPFDVIFCRNVMIYFDNPTKKSLIENMFRFTSPGGYLFIGHSESLGRTDCPYEYVRPAVYRKALTS